MVRFVEEHREEYGVEPICNVLPIAPSTYYAHKVQEADPTLRSQRSQRDEALREGGGPTGSADPSQRPWSAR
jgi:putative transposase